MRVDALVIAMAFASACSATRRVSIPAPTSDGVLKNAVPSADLVPALEVVGQVLFEGKPVADAVVTLQGQGVDALHTHTDGRGQFRFADLRRWPWLAEFDGEYLIHADKDGRDASARVDTYPWVEAQGLKYSRTAHRVAVALELRGSTRLAGVLRHADGRPAGYFPVSLTQRDAVRRDVFTGPDGRFEFLYLEPGLAVCHALEAFGTDLVGQAWDLSE